MKTYLSSGQVRRRYGNRSYCTLWRWEKNPALDFPKPDITEPRKLWDEAKLDAWDEMIRQREADDQRGIPEVA